MAITVTGHGQEPKDVGASIAQRASNQQHYEPTECQSAEAVILVQLVLEETQPRAKASSCCKQGTQEDPPIVDSQHDVPVLLPILIADVPLLLHVLLQWCCQVVTGSAGELDP